MGVSAALGAWSLGLHSAGTGSLSSLLCWQTLGPRMEQPLAVVRNLVSVPDTTPFPLGRVSWLGSLLGILMYRCEEVSPDT